MLTRKHLCDLAHMSAVPRPRNPGVEGGQVWEVSFAGVDGRGAGPLGGRARKTLSGTLTSSQRQWGPLGLCMPLTV